MIAVLRRHHHQKYVSTYYRKKGERWWSDDEIREAFKLTEKEFKAALAAYENAGPRPWTREDLVKKVLAFAVKRNRWPTGREMEEDHRELDLPPRTSMQYHFEGRWGGASSFDNLQEWIVDSSKYYQKLTPKLILSIKNVTVRRKAMLKYGVERLLRKGGGECIQQDDAGKLWRLPSDNRTDKHAQWVEVVNTSPEPDGSFAHFFLRVPPTVETARAAVAWTAQETAGTYKVKVAT